MDKVNVDTLSNKYIILIDKEILGVNIHLAKSCEKIRVCFLKENKKPCGSKISVDTDSL